MSPYDVTRPQRVNSPGRFCPRAFCSNNVSELLQLATSFNQIYFTTENYLRGDGVSVKDLYLVVLVVFDAINYNN